MLFYLTLRELKPSLSELCFAACRRHFVQKKTVALQDVVRIQFL